MGYNEDDGGYEFQPRSGPITLTFLQNGLASL